MLVVLKMEGKRAANQGSFDETLIELLLTPPPPTNKPTKNHHYIGIIKNTQRFKLKIPIMINK